MIALIVADDFTGACDAAVAFSARAREVHVLSAGAAFAGTAEVAALSTESRHAPMEAIEEHILIAVDMVAAHHPHFLFKKVDSVFRGNTFAEIAAWVKAFRDRLVVLAPAYPVLGRKVCKGRLTTSDLSGSHVVNLLAGLDVHLADVECVSIESCEDARVLAGQMMQAWASGRHLVLCDAVNDRELSCTVQAGISTGLDILWAGSGGLAHALSALLPKQRSIAPKPETPGPILFCIGSPHAATLQQMSYLKKTQGCVELLLSSTTASGVEKCLRGGSNVLLRIDRDPCDPQALADVLEPLSRKAAGALFLSGGDTAALACQALHVGVIALRGELLPGVPWGVIRGGPAEDLVIATKSGGFGPEQALAHAAFALTQARRATG